MRYPGLACCPVRARGKSRRLRYGRFEYRVLLPGHAKADTVTAALADGVLTVTVPKAEADKPRCIEITAD